MGRQVEGETGGEREGGRKGLPPLTPRHSSINGCNLQSQSCSNYTTHLLPVKARSRRERSDARYTSLQHERNDAVWRGGGGNSGKTASTELLTFPVKVASFSPFRQRVFVRKSVGARESFYKGSALNRCRGPDVSGQVMWREGVCSLLGEA